MRNLCVRDRMATDAPLVAMVMGTEGEAIAAGNAVVAAMPTSAAAPLTKPYVVGENEACITHMHAKRTAKNPGSMKIMLKSMINSSYNV